MKDTRETTSNNAVDQVYDPTTLSKEERVRIENFIRSQPKTESGFLEQIYQSLSNFLQDDEEFKEFLNDPKSYSFDGKILEVKNIKSESMYLLVRVRASENRLEVSLIVSFDKSTLDRLLKRSYQPYLPDFSHRTLVFHPYGYNDSINKWTASGGSQTIASESNRGVGTALTIFSVPLMRRVYPKVNQVAKFGSVKQIQFKVVDTSTSSNQLKTEILGSRGWTSKLAEGLGMKKSEDSNNFYYDIIF